MMPFIKTEQGMVHSDMCTIENGTSVEAKIYYLAIGLCVVEDNCVGWDRFQESAQEITDDFGNIWLRMCHLFDVSDRNELGVVMSYKRLKVFEVLK